MNGANRPRLPPRRYADQKEKRTAKWHAVDLLVAGEGFEPSCSPRAGMNRELCGQRRVRGPAPRARGEQVREMLLRGANIVPQAAEHHLLVRIHSPANPRHNNALVKLCATLNALEVRYPGTDLTLVYEAPEVASILAPMSGVLTLTADQSGAV
jgi:hypothetical protein